MLVYIRVRILKNVTNIFAWQINIEFLIYFIQIKVHCWKKILKIHLFLSKHKNDELLMSSNCFEKNFGEFRNLDKLCMLISVILSLSLYFIILMFLESFKKILFYCNKHFIEILTYHALFAEIFSEFWFR